MRFIDSSKNRKKEVSGKIDINGINANVDYLPFNTSYSEVGSEPIGSIFWDNTHGTFAGKTGINTKLDFGQEVRYYGKAEGNILNGEVVQFAGSQGDHVLFKKAVASEIIENPRLLMGLATENISNGSFGNIVEFGYINDINTTGWSINDLLYWDNSTGQLTNVMPEAPNRCILIAAVIKEETSPPASNGKLLVRIMWGTKMIELEDFDGTPLISDGQFPVWNNTMGYFDPNFNINDYAKQEIFSDALKEPTGFENRRHSTMSFSVVSNEAVFSITPNTPTYTEYNIWIVGTKYIIDETKSITLPDTEGLHVIYFDTDEELKSILNPGYAEMLTVIKEKAIVSLLYWDATNKVIVYDGEERHGSMMDGMTHYYLHYTQGMKWVEGLGLGDFLIGNGSLDAHAQFSTEAGLVSDEDLGLTIDTVDSTTGFPILYRTGANGYWRRLEQTGFACYRGVNTRLSWNEWDTGISEWKLSEVDNNDYVLYHIFATTGYDDAMFSIMGQGDYATLPQARAGAAVEVSSLLLGILPSPEIFPVATIIYQTGNYGNTVNARIVLTDEGENYIDWRSSDLPRGSAPTDHGNLTGLGDDDHIQYLRTDGTRDVTGIIAYDADKTFTTDQDIIAKKYVDDLDGQNVKLTGDQSIDGIKTFTSFPVTPSEAPSTDYQVANKKYIDDLDDANVKLTGDQIIASGVKTFIEFPAISSGDPISDLQFATKKYVDDNSGGGGSGYVDLTTDQTITSGVKTFNEFPEISSGDPTTDLQFATKKYVDSYRSGEVIEQLSSPCDGSVISLLSGNYTVQEVTERYIPSSVAHTAITGSSLTYTPPAGTKAVEYDFSFLMARGESGHDTGILHLALYIDGVEVLYSRKTPRDTYESLLRFNWTIHIGGDADANTGRQASWTTPKVIELRCRAYSTSYDQDLHWSWYWGGSIAQYQLSLPHISLKAIG